jgi:hypothetical protein
MAIAEEEHLNSAYHSSLMQLPAAPQQAGRRSRTWGSQQKLFVQVPLGQVVDCVLGSAE